MKKLVECPICKGFGLIEPTNKQLIEQKRDMAKRLKASKMPLRDIADFLGYKSVSSVAELLKD